MLVLKISFFETERGHTLGPFQRDTNPGSPGPGGTEARAGLGAPRGPLGAPRGPLGAPWGAPWGPRGARALFGTRRTQGTSPRNFRRKR